MHRMDLILGLARLEFDDSRHVRDVSLLLVSFSPDRLNISIIFPEASSVCLDAAEAHFY